MKYFIFNYRDKKLKCFDAPIVTTEAPDQYAAHVQRTLIKAKPLDQTFAVDKALYFFGTFDDESGKFEICEPTKILDCEDFLPSFADCVEAYIKSNQRDIQNDEIVYRYEFNLKRNEEIAKLQEVKPDGKQN